MRLHYIYRITHIATGRVYIGQTVDPRKRWNGHNGTGSGCRFLHNALVKYGKDAFDFCVIDQCETHEQANDLEVHYISVHRSNDHIHGFNLMSGGSSNSTHSEETKRKLSAALKGRPSGHKGKLHTEEARALISLRKKGVKHTDEARANMAAAIRGMTGLKHSEESKTKMSASAVGRKHSPETRAKMSATHKNRRRTA